MANNGLIAQDTFQRADSTGLGANWTVDFRATAEENIASHVVVPPALSSTYGQYYTGVAFPADQTSEVTLSTSFNALGGANDFTVLTVRGSTSADTSYAAQIISSATQATLQLAKIVAGVATNIGSAIGITASPGDVWTFQVAGSMLSVYQNYARVTYAADTSIATGLPGFRVFASNSVNNVGISAWRGYDCTQQDGIWAKKGIAIAANAAGLANSGIGPSTNSIVLHEGNAQILSGTVYKMWFGAGPQTVQSFIDYAESLDGVAWTRHGSVLASFITPGIIKNGSTYYMYCQAGASAGSGNINLYTSTDGITWTQQSTTILALGTAGQWDDTFLWSFNPIAIIGGTWYALYSAGHDTTSYQFSVGLATSPDGVTWTKHVGNPVISGVYTGQCFAKVGGTYYLWTARSQPGQGNVHPSEDPTEAIRYQSTDLINWTNPVHSVHHSQIFENVNGTAGQSFGNAIIDIGGKAYLYTTSALSDDMVPNLFQIGYAVGPAPIASIVTQPEDGVQQVATDSFTRADGGLGANWTTPTGGTAPQIASHEVEPSTTNTVCEALYTATAANNDQYSEVTVNSLATSTGIIYVVVRGNTSSSNCYECVVNNGAGSPPTTLRIFKKISGVETQIGPSMACTVGATDVIRLQVVGNVLSAFQNGFLMLQVNDVNNTITSGLPGFQLFVSSGALTQAQISSWAGGNANVIPAFAGGLSAVQHYAPAKSAAHQFGSHIG